MQQYKVAGYVRLSKEDIIKDESNSITNQKAIINSYIKNKSCLKYSINKKELEKLVIED